MGIRGTFSISWELGPALAPSGCSPVPWRAIPGLTSWLNCRGCLLEQCAELSTVVIRRMLFAFGCSSTYFFWCFIFQAVFKIYIQKWGAFLSLIRVRA